MVFSFPSVICSSSLACSEVIRMRKQHSRHIHWFHSQNFVSKSSSFSEHEDKSVVTLSTSFSHVKIPVSSQLPPTSYLKYLPPCASLATILCTQTEPLCTRKSVSTVPVFLWDTPSSLPLPAPPRDPDPGWTSLVQSFASLRQITAHNIAGKVLSSPERFSRPTPPPGMSTP